MYRANFASFRLPSNTAGIYDNQHRLEFNSSNVIGQSFNHLSSTLLKESTKTLTSSRTKHNSLSSFSTHTNHSTPLFKDNPFKDPFFIHKKQFSTESKKSHKETEIVAKPAKKFNLALASKPTLKAVEILLKAEECRKKGIPVIIVFDFDETLANTTKRMCNAVREVFTQLSLITPDWLEHDEEIMKRLNNHPDKAFPSLFGEQAELGKASYFKTLIQNPLQDVELVPGTIKLLEHLIDAGISNIFISSCQKHDVLIQQAEGLGLTPFIKDINGTKNISEDDKPNIGALVRSIAKSGLRLDQPICAIVIGDSTLGTDKDLALKLNELLHQYGGGCDFIGFGKGKFRRAEGHQEKAHITTPSYFSNLLKHVKEAEEFYKKNHNLFLGRYGLSKNESGIKSL